MALATTSHHTHRLVGWNPPLFGSIKVNVDSSSLGNLSSAGCGGLARDSSGAWLRGFYCSIGVASNLYAELLAILHGLKLARRLGYDL